MKTNTQIQAPTPTVEQFQSALRRGEEAIREAANILCQMVDADPKAYEKIHKETGIHWNVLANLERVGRGAMHYKLLFDTSPASRHIQLLPASKQEELYDKGVKVISIQNGKTVIEEKKASELTREQVKIVFAPDSHVRSVDEQIKAASEQTKPQKSNFMAQRYIIEGDKLIIPAQTMFTLVQLEEILEKMKQNEIKKLATKQTK